MSRTPEDEPFPLEAVRDLLGLVRSLYASRRAALAGRVELARISAVGKELTDAIDIAASTRPGSAAHRAACARAERAALDAGSLVDVMTPAAPLMVAARGRIAASSATLRKRKQQR